MNSYASYRSHVILIVHMKSIEGILKIHFIRLFSCLDIYYNKGDFGITIVLVMTA